MTNVRVVKGQRDYQEGEYSVLCDGCGCELAVLVPLRVQWDDDKAQDWLSERYFYCSTCQKLEGRPAVQKGA